MKYKFIASSLLLSIMALALTACSKGTIDRYKKRINPYSNEVSEADLVVTNDKLLEKSNEIRANDYVISLESFERMMYEEYFKANKTDTTVKSNSERSRNNKISYDASSGSYHTLSEENMTSEVVDVKTTNQSSNSSSFDQSYEDIGVGAILFDNKAMTYQKLPKPLWSNIKDKMSPYVILHALGAMKYFSSAPMRFYADGNQFTITVDDSSDGIDRNGELQFIISDKKINCSYYFTLIEIYDGNQYSEKAIELGGSINIEAKPVELKDRALDRYIDLDNRLA